MKLTGKAKEDFEAWYLKQEYCLASLESFEEEKITKHFKAMALPFKYGVYVDWFDSVGIYVQVCIEDYEPLMWQYLVEMLGDDDIHDTDEGGFKTRPEARTKAIECANNIYNENS